MAQETQLRNVLRIMSALASLVSMVIFVFVLLAFRAGEERQRLGLEATVKALDSLQQNVAAMRVSIDNSAKNLTAVDATFSKVQSQVNSLEAKVVDAQKANAATNQQLPQIAASIENINRMMAAELPRPLIEAPQLLDAGAAKGVKGPTTVPAAATRPKLISIIEVMKGMPAAMKAKAGETERHVAEREDWVKEHLIGKLTVVTFVVEMTRNNSVTGVHPFNRGEFSAFCQFSESMEKKVYSGDSVTVEGEVDRVAVYSFDDSSSDAIVLKNCRIILLDKK